jgi:hypothetical protein
LSESEETDVATMFDQVSDHLGLDVANQLAESLQKHYSRWKVQRRSESATLAVAKHILCSAGFAKLCRNPEWIINRGIAEYQKHLGTADLTYASKLSKLLPERLSAVADPRKDLLYMDSGPGNGTALYEGAQPGWMGVGLGIQLLFSIEGTLQNCLCPSVQGDSDGRTPSYASKLFRKAELDLQMLSVLEFLEGTDTADRWDEAFREWALLPETASATKIKELIAKTTVVKEMLAEIDSTRLATAIFLGLLLDEFDGRYRYPNGMNFRADLLHAVISAVPKAIAAAPATVRTEHPGTDEIEESTAKLLRLVEKRYAHDAQNRQTVDDLEIDHFDTMAARLRTLAFASLKRMDEEPRQMLFSGANETWRWIFFERDSTRWRTNGPTPPQEDALITWLNRPWGMLQEDEMDHLLRDVVVPDKPDDQPVGLILLGSFIRSGVSEGLERLFPQSLPKASRMQRLARFARRRIALSAQRRNVSHVILDATDSMALNVKAQILIQSFALWVQGQPELLEDVEAAPAKLATHFLGKRWPDGIATNLTRAQQRVIEEFSKAPLSYVDGIFEFEELEEYAYHVIDFYPPEQFELLEV